MFVICVQVCVCMTALHGQGRAIRDAREEQGSLQRSEDHHGVIYAGMGTDH